jgi:hypothetical protein
MALDNRCKGVFVTFLDKTLEQLAIGRIAWLSGAG